MRRVLYLFALVICLALWVIPAWCLDLPGDLLDYLHFPGGALLCFLLLKAIRRKIVFPLFAMLSCVLEFGQLFSDRTFSFADIAMTWAGGAVVLLFVLKSSPGRRWAMVGLVLLVLPRVWLTAHEAGLRVYERNLYPYLLNGSSHFQKNLWECSGSTLTRIQTNAMKAWRLQVTDPDMAYPGMFLKDADRAWPDVDAVCLDLYSQEASDRLWLRIDDLPAPEYGERFQLLLVLSQGWNRICIPKERIVHSSSGQPIDFSSIDQFGVFWDDASRVHPIVIEKIYIQTESR